MKYNHTRGVKVRLCTEDCDRLRSWQRTRKLTGPQARRARIVALLGSGLRQCDVAAQTGAGIATVGRVRRRALVEGVEAAVFGYISSGAPRLLDVLQEAKLVALACSAPPAGRARWTVRLLATECVRRRHVKHVARKTVPLILKHHGVKPWREKNVVHTPPG